MRIDISKIRPGDRVEVYFDGGYQWRTVSAVRHQGIEYDDIGGFGYAHHSIMRGHQPAQPEPETAEWVTFSEWDDMPRVPYLSPEHINVLNRLLTKKYGNPPVVHTYNGEPPKQYGLNRKNEVLYWSGEAWCCTIYVNLARGDRWMKQPPAPKKVGS